MTKIKVTYYGLIRNVVDNKEAEDYPYNGATVREVIGSLAQRYGDRFRSMILTSDWQIHPLAIIQLNGHDINEIEGLNTKLEDNSELCITVIPYLIIGG